MRRGTWARIGPALLLAFLLVGTVAGTLAAARRVHDREREELANAARLTAQAIDRRMQDYTAVLRGAAGLYESSADVTPEEYGRFFSGQGVKQRFPGVAGILHASLVPAAALDAYERRNRAEVARSGLPYPAFRVHPAPAPGAHALVVDRLDAPTRTSVAFGLDLLTDRDRRGPALRAGRTGRPAASAPLRIFLQRGSSLGVVLMVPVTDPAAHRWAGVVYAAFRMDELLRGVLGATGSDVDLELYDIGPAATTPARSVIGPAAAAFDLRQGSARPPLSGAHTKIETLAVAGRRWAVAYTDRTTPVSAVERLVPWLIAVSGLLVSLLAAALLRAFATAQSRAVGLAESMTTELRERELQLQRSNEELEHFAYLASHDLQEPLRTITSYAGLLESRAGTELDDRARSWLGFVSDGAERMSHLIADLLEYSRTGSTRANAVPTALDEAWDLAVANLDHSIAESRATVTRDELPVIAARPREMTSMLQNLIANGLKYRGEAAPVVHASAHRTTGGWELAVRDNGIGIEPRFHERVFGLFQRLHTTEEYAGTGMGLAIVKKIAESNGGSVRVESSPGEGATFVVTLRAQDA